VNTAILEAVPLDFKTPFDELSELRAVLTTQEIAELTGLRRETISRARRDSRFQRRTEKTLGDLYLVVTRMRSIAGEDLGQLGAILRRPQSILGERSIADLLKEGRVDLVLEHLTAPEPTPASAPIAIEPPEDPPPTLEVEAHLRPWKPLGPVEMQAYRDRQEAEVAAFLADDPEFAAGLPGIEARVREHFGPEVWIERGVDEEPGAEDGLYLRAHNGLPFDENLTRLEALLKQERDLRDPVRNRVTVGFL
jgi:hypothetical protein